MVVPAPLYAQRYKSVAERTREGGKDGYVEDASAGKRLKKKKSESVEVEPALAAATPSVQELPVPAAKKRQAIQYPDSKKKKRYRIAVVAPLYLDELVRGEAVTFKDRVPEKAAPGLGFYQGVKLAADSLRRAGAKLDIDVFDAGSYGESPEILIDHRKFDSADLIIGAVEQHDIPVLASFARKKRINFVSALINYDGWVKDNQYFSMLQPSLKSHCEFIIDDLSAKYPGQNVTLLYRTSSLADDNAALYILNDLYSDVVFRKLQCNTRPQREVLDEVFDTTKPNIVVMSISDGVFADSILRQLTAWYPNTHFEIYGMPGWHANANLLKPGLYKNLTVNVTYPFNFESAADSALLQSVRDAYGREFGGVPGEMTWRGYEAILWYASLLREYGTIFNDEYKDLSGAPFTKYRIKPRWDRNGSLLYLENKNIYMSTYQGGVHSTK